MRVNRNDPCPCGSGRKLKKCCSKKTEVVQLAIIREERFYEQKQVLAHKPIDFILGKLNFN